MLEAANVDADAIADALRGAYGVTALDIEFLPLGADRDTAAYRIATTDHQIFFLKLRSGAFNEASVRVPNYLTNQGMQQIISPLATVRGELTASLPPYRVILYPYVDGQNAVEHRMTEAQWAQFGSALRQLHNTSLPNEIARGTPSEDFSPRWRDECRAFLRRVGTEEYRDPATAELAALLQERSADIAGVLRKAEHYARLAADSSPEFVLCHGDVHAWNLLIDRMDRLHIVDWDTLVFAPKERDLMFIGGGIGDTGYAPEEEVRLFYQGYGPVRINGATLAYYRYERIIEDMVAYCRQVFLATDGGEDRAQALKNLASNFRPGGTLERAEAAEHHITRE